MIRLTSGKAFEPLIEPDTTILAYHEQIYAPVKLAMKSEKTQHQYLCCYRMLDRFLQRPATLADLNDATVTAFIGWGMKELNWARETARKALNHLRALWRYAARKRHVVEFPDVDAPKQVKRVPQAWSLEQLRMIVEAGAKMHGMVGCVPARKFWPALVMFLYDTGLRIGAAMQAQWENLDLESRTLFIDGETQKQLSDQSLMLHRDTIEALKAIRTSDRRLFPFPYHVHTLYNRFRAVVVKAGLSADRRSLFHKIRRTAATHLATVAGEAAATSLLGHSSGHVTKVYIDPTKLERPCYPDMMPRPDIDLAAVEYSDPSKAPIGDHVAVFEAALDVAGYGELFQKNTRELLAMFLRDTAVGTAADIDATLVMNWIADQQAKGLAIKTVRARKQTVAMFLRWLVEKCECGGTVVDAYGVVCTNVCDNRLFGGKPGRTIKPRAIPEPEAPLVPGSVQWFYETHYLPGRLGSFADQRNMRHAIKQFGEFLNREPMLPDLTAANFYAFGHARSCDHAPSTVRAELELLRRLARAAGEAEGGAT